MPTPEGVTVVVPVHDRAGLLPATLGSIFAQVPPPAEVLVVDDASSDGSAEVAASLGARVIRRSESVGNPGPARNDGIRAARTPWVAFCDSDDLWTQGHLAGLLAAVDPDAVLVSAPARTSDGGWLGNVRPRLLQVDAAGLLSPGVNIVASATMVRRDAALAVGGFASRLAEDLDLWLRLLGAGHAVLTTAPTVIYQVHPGQMSHRGGVYAEAEAIVAEHRGDPWFRRGLGERWASQLRWDELRRALADRDLRLASRTAVGLLRPAALGGVGALLLHRRRTHAAIRNNPEPRPPAGSTHPGDSGAGAGDPVHPGG